jgi:hypothetical protein
VVQHSVVVVQQVEQVELVLHENYLFNGILK